MHLELCGSLSMTDTKDGHGVKFAVQFLSFSPISYNSCTYQVFCFKTQSQSEYYRIFSPITSSENQNPSVIILIIAKEIEKLYQKFTNVL